MLVPHHMKPHISGKGYTPYLGYWLPLAITQNTHFPGFSGNLPETTVKNTPFPEKMGPTHAAPLCVRVRGSDDSHECK